MPPPPCLSRCKLHEIEAMVRGSGTPTAFQTIKQERKNDEVFDEEEQEQEEEEEEEEEQEEEEQEQEEDAIMEV